MYLRIIDDESDSDFRLRQLRSNVLTVLRWWQDECSAFPILSKLALRVFSLVSSTAAVERTFKVQGSIHTKLRNRLKSEVCKKLTFVRVNSGLYQNLTLPESILAMTDPDLVSTDPQNDLGEEVTVSFETEFEIDPNQEDE